MNQCFYSLAHSEKGLKTLDYSADDLMPCCAKRVPSKNNIINKGERKTPDTVWCFSFALFFSIELNITGFKGTYLHNTGWAAILSSSNFHT